MCVIIFWLNCSNIIIVNRSKGEQVLENTDKVKITSEGNTYCLTLMNLVEEDGGQFTIKAQNDVGQTSCTATLLVHGTHRLLSFFFWLLNSSRFSISKQKHSCYKLLFCQLNLIVFSLYFTLLCESLLHILKIMISFLPLLMSTLVELVLISAKQVLITHPEFYHVFLS